MTATTAPSLLVVGADSYVLRACAELGVDTVLVSGPGARDGGDHRIPDSVRSVFVDDQKNPESVLTGLHRAGLGGHRFDAVLTPAEYALVFSAVLARSLGCRGIEPETAVRFRDKWLQKEYVRAAGLSTARSLVIEDIHLSADLPELPWERAVLKPISGVGTRLTTVVRDTAGLRAAAAGFARQDPRLRTFVLEEFVDGDEWLVDGVVREGEVVFHSVAAYGQPCLSAVSSRQPLKFRRFDPDSDKQVYAAVDPVVTGALKALGLRDGLFHMELFHQGDQVIFSECAARRGSALVQEEVHCKFNVDLGEEAVRAALGLPPRLDVAVLPDTVGATYLNGRPGTLVSRPSRAEVLARDGVRFVQHELPLGSLIPEGLSDTGTQVAQVVITAESPEQFDERVDALLTWYDDRLVVAPIDRTPRVLRAWQRETWPDEDHEPLLFRQR
jgi:biotin carboxylase